MSAQKIRVRLAEDGRAYEVAPSLCYTCPESVPASAVNVPVEAYAPDGIGPISVIVRARGARRPALAKTNPDPLTGSRVLLSLMSRDMLALFVAIVEPAR
jgi:hypothetical protein